jgi:hypothetical protein
MSLPPELFVVLKGSNRWRKVVVLDLWLYVENFDPRYEIKPFETPIQALWRHFPDCKIYLVENGKIWVPGPRQRNQNRGGFRL